MTTVQVIQFECNEAKVADAIDALSTFVIGRPRIFARAPLPPSPKKAEEFEALAQAVVKAVRPKPNQPMRREILRLVLGGGDTWSYQKGESDPALRNGTGALSKSLRRLARLGDSPLDLICTREREVVEAGPYKGRYQGTRYVPNRLGRRVKQILEQQGII